MTWNQAIIAKSRHLRKLASGCWHHARRPLSDSKSKSPPSVEDVGQGHEVDRESRLKRELSEASHELRDQWRHSLRPSGVDPRSTSIILFPGQGSQFVGMGQNLVKRVPHVMDMFESASSILGYDLYKLCTEGPKEMLDRTEHAQPAILVCSLAALERLKEERPSAIETCIATAGFSLGEISALTFAEVFSFETAVRLVKVRAEAMQAASDLEPGAMVTVLYRADTNIAEACRRAREHCATVAPTSKPSSSSGEGSNEEHSPFQPYCAVSNYLFPQGKIIAGHEEAIKFLENNKEELGLKKLRRLPVSGAFHTPLMKPAVEVFRVALRKAKVGEPQIAVHSNVDGKRYKDQRHVIKQLPYQIVAPVKWEQTMHVIYERPKEDEPRFPHTYECGPGNSLATMLKMVNSKAWQSCLSIMA